MNYLRGTYGSKTSSADDSAQVDHANDLSGMAGEGASFDATVAPPSPGFDAIGAMGGGGGGLAPFDPYSLGTESFKATEE
jgi:hypothetical protein